MRRRPPRTGPALAIGTNLVELSLEIGDFERNIRDGRSLARRLRQNSHPSFIAHVLYLLAAAHVERGEAAEALTAAAEAAPAMRDQGSCLAAPALEQRGGSDHNRLRGMIFACELPLQGRFKMDCDTAGSGFAVSQ